MAPFPPIGLGIFQSSSPRGAHPLRTVSSPNEKCQCSRLRRHKTDGGKLITNERHNESAGFGIVGICGDVCFRREIRFESAEILFLLLPFS